LRQLFQEKLGTGDDVFANTSNVVVSPQGGLPSTFEGKTLTEDHEDTLKLINKDYSQVMKKMGV